MIWLYEQTDDFAQVQQLGLQGWELVGALLDSETGAEVYTLKKRAGLLKPRFTIEQRDRFFDPGSAHAAARVGPGQSPLLNPQVAELVKGIGHTDMLLLADKGFPVPRHLPTIDLSVSAGIPTILQIMDAIAADFAWECAIIAEELGQAGAKAPEATEWIEALRARAQARGGRVEAYAHIIFKDIAEHAVAAIRSGDAVPFANTLLVSG